MSKTFDFGELFPLVSRIVQQTHRDTVDVMADDEMPYEKELGDTVCDLFRNAVLGQTAITVRDKAHEMVLRALWDVGADGSTDADMSDAQRRAGASRDQGRRKRMATTNAATDKQIAYILSLCRGRHESDAFREIAQDMGCSTTAATKRATKQDASITIERLKKGA